MGGVKLIERLTSLFSFTLLAVAVFLIYEFKWPGAACATVWIFLTPPLTWRLLSKFYPTQFGQHFIGKSKKTSPWLISYNIQQIFFILPWLEKLLLTVPGLYSAWLRLWGAKIGKNVFWAPGVQILDRPFIRVGDWSVIGQDVCISSHVVTKKNNSVQLYFRDVEIGERSIIGAFSIIGAGTKVADNEVLKVATKTFGARRLEWT